MQNILVRPMVLWAMNLKLIPCRTTLNLMIGRSVLFKVLLDSVAPGKNHGMDINDQGKGVINAAFVSA